MTNAILLLSFGLSSVFLSVSIMISMVVNLSCWLILIGRYIFEYIHINSIATTIAIRTTTTTTIQSKIADEEQRSNIDLRDSGKCKLYYIHHYSICISIYLININYFLFLELEMTQNSKEIQRNSSRTTKSQLSTSETLPNDFTLMNISFLQLIEEVNNSIEYINVCKWLVICTPCLFITILSWDIVGDQSGWYNALWVPLTGISMLIVLRFINQLTMRLSLFEFVWKMILDDESS